MSTPDNIAPGATPTSEGAPQRRTPTDFLREQVRADLAAEGSDGRVLTRFPPEPNGFLHLGHAKSIALNFELAHEFGGRTNLRFDDTNPAAEKADYVDAMIEDIEWLGYQPDQVCFASDYFEQLYQWAESLIEGGFAYVDDLDAATISEQRGGFTTPGIDSPWRDRPVEENLDLFRRMRAGEFGDGERVLRARIDMNHENMQMRDPVLYRIRHLDHHQTGSSWCIFPTYDWAHGQSDAIEGITHSICTLEFDAHRPLYDWLLAHLDLPRGKPEQYEFARLNVTHVVTSKRKLAQLVDEGHVDGWDDPRMPTIRGMRRLGYPPAALRSFCAHTGVGKVDGTVEVELLESFVRTELNKTAQRRMAVLNPLKVVIENYPEDAVEYLDAVNNPEDPAAGSRAVPFSRELFIERDDFMEDPPKKFFRLAPGREVRLRYGYFITCQETMTDADGNLVALRCTYDPETSGGQAPDGRKVKATLHWVSAAHAVPATVMTYDRLFSDPHPSSHEGVDPLSFLNPDSRIRIEDAQLEPSVVDLDDGETVQFERLGYFTAEQSWTAGSSSTDRPVFHRTVGLRDEWARIQKRSS